MLPVDLLRPCVHAIEELVRNHRCSAVLCSATQPALRPLFDPGMAIHEICTNHAALYDALRRVRFASLGRVSDAELLERLNAHRKVLCIVNTKIQAQALYEGLSGDGNFHLSTLMTPSLRRKTLEQIRQRLDDKQTCRVVSTSLIEAGVDVDFPYVYREEAGLDSAVQAAGRCNREGELSPDEAIVSLFRPDEAYRNKRPRSLGQPIEVMRMIEKQYNDDIASPEAIHAYFSQLFAFKGERLDKQGIVKRLDDCMKTRNLSIPFAEVAKLFRVIDSPTRAVLIPEDEAAAEIIAQLESGVRSARLMRKAGMHTVAVYPKQFDALLGAGAIRMLDEELAVLRDESLYTKDTGLHIPDGGIGIIA
jgi:CRISPR-associated endonuclease/helicase Cas3